MHTHTVFKKQCGQLVEKFCPVCYAEPIHALGRSVDEIMYKIIKPPAMQCFSKVGVFPESGPKTALRILRICSVEIVNVCSIFDYRTSQKGH